MVEEIWREVVGYEGKYSVSTWGMVRNGSGDILCPWLSMGYPYVGLWKNGEQEKVAVHRLMAIAFLPNPLNHPQVNHIDGIKSHNTIDNLEWASAKENSDHACSTGLVERKLMPEEISEIKALRTRKPLMGMKAVAKLFGIHHSMVIWIWRNDDY